MSCGFWQLLFPSTVKASASSSLRSRVGALSLTWQLHSRIFLGLPLSDQEMLVAAGKREQSVDALPAFYHTAVLTCWVLPHKAEQPRVTVTLCTRTKPIQDEGIVKYYAGVQHRDKTGKRKSFSLLVCAHSHTHGFWTEALALKRARVSIIHSLKVVGANIKKTAA